MVVVIIIFMVMSVRITTIVRIVMIKNSSNNNSRNSKTSNKIISGISVSIMTIIISSRNDPNADSINNSNKKTLIMLVSLEIPIYIHTHTYTRMCNTMHCDILSLQQLGSSAQSGGCHTIPISDESDPASGFWRLGFWGFRV